MQLSRKIFLAVSSAVLMYSAVIVDKVEHAKTFYIACRPADSYWVSSRTRYFTFGGATRASIDKLSFSERFMVFVHPTDIRAFAHICWALPTTDVHVEMRQSPGVFVFTIASPFWSSSDNICDAMVRGLQGGVLNGYYDGHDAHQYARIPEEVGRPELESWNRQFDREYRKMLDLRRPDGAK